MPMAIYTLEPFDNKITGVNSTIFYRAVNTKIGDVFQGSAL
jgi:hypothetical protein